MTTSSAVASVRSATAAGTSAAMPAPVMYRMMLSKPFTCPILPHRARATKCPRPAAPRADAPGGATSKTQKPGRPFRSDPALCVELKLLELDRGTGGLEDLLGLLGVFLLGTLEDRLGGLVDERLGLAKTEVREGTDLLDDLDLLVANDGQDDVERGLLLDLFGLGG